MILRSREKKLIYEKEMQLAQYLFTLWARPMFFVFDQQWSLVWRWWWLDFDTNSLPENINDLPFLDILKSFWVRSDDVRRVEDVILGLKHNKWSKKAIGIQTIDWRAYNLMFFKRNNWVFQATLDDVDHIGDRRISESNIISKSIESNSIRIFNLLSASESLEQGNIDVKDFIGQFNKTIRDLLRELNKTLIITKPMFPYAENKNWDQLLHQAVSGQMQSEMNHATGFVDHAQPTFLLAPNSFEDIVFVLNQKYKWKYQSLLHAVKKLNKNWTLQWSRQKEGEFKWIINWDNNSNHFIDLGRKTFFVKNKPTIFVWWHQASLFPKDAEQLDWVLMKFRMKLETLEESVNLINIENSEANKRKLLRLHRDFRNLVVKE